MTPLLVFVGGMIGAPTRYLLDRLIQRRHDSVFPWGTFAVNVAGSLILGLLLGAGSSLPRELTVLLGTGFCGALTTFSTFGFETMRLLEEGSVLEAGLNALGSLLLGVAAAFCGSQLGSLL